MELLTGIMPWKPWVAHLLYAGWSPMDIFRRIVELPSVETRSYSTIWRYAHSLTRAGKYVPWAETLPGDWPPPAEIEIEPMYERKLEYSYKVAASYYDPETGELKNIYVMPQSDIERSRQSILEEASEMYGVSDPEVAADLFGMRIESVERMSLWRAD